MTPEEREEVGFKCKKLIDMGRVHYLRENGFSAQLVAYTDLSLTLENVVLLATNQKGIYIAPSYQLKPYLHRRATFLGVVKMNGLSAPDACDARDFFGHAYDATWIGFGSVFIALRMRKKCLDQSGVRSVTWQGNLVRQGQLSPC